MPTVTQPGRIQHLFSGIGALLLSLIFLAMGHTALSFSSDCWKRRDCESWPKTTGTILDADIIHTTIRNKRQTQERHSYAVEFEYE